ncbi:ROK family transcriptional regulator [Fictibacillus sp. Mic-4]|uniref:ROK family transcriptional regulator n=1 Tax=Fictibacillus sp. Mic-4 TaxID=3132826 RepID=UPI003CFB9A34
MQRRTGDLKLIQELNRSIILNMIREHGPISRSEIAKKNKISPTTVTAAVNEFIREGLVSEVGTGKSSGGRKPILIRFNPDGGFLISVSVTNSAIKVAELNLQAAIRKKDLFPVHDVKGDELIEFTLRSIEEFIGRLSDLTKCVGISITAPGIVDAAKGVIRYNSKLDLINVPVKALFESRFGLKTYLDNDVNAMVLAEKKYGKSIHSTNLVYVTIDEGLGTGILVNGSIFRGHHGGAGELGHTSISPDGIPCECGNNGCLENYVHWPAIRSKIEQQVNIGYPSLIRDLLEQEQTPLTPQMFKTAIKQGDPLATSIMEEVASYLSIGIANAINLFNPETVILGGVIAEDNPQLINQIQTAVSKRALHILTEGLEIRTSSFAEDADLIGAAAVLLQDLFQFSLHA